MLIAATPSQLNGLNQHLQLDSSLHLRTGHSLQAGKAQTHPVDSDAPWPCLIPFGFTEYQPWAIQVHNPPRLLPRAGSPPALFLYLKPYLTNCNFLSIKICLKSVWEPSSRLKATRLFTRQTGALAITRLHKVWPITELRTWIPHLGTATPVPLL